MENFPRLGFFRNQISLIDFHQTRSKLAWVHFRYARNRDLCHVV